MSLARPGGRFHSVQYVGCGDYRLSWEYEYKIAGSRLLWHRRMTRDTDKAGAERFCRKWGCQMPEVTR